MTRKDVGLNFLSFLYKWFYLIYWRFSNILIVFEPPFTLYNLTDRMSNKKMWIGSLVHRAIISVYTSKIWLLFIADSYFYVILTFKSFNVDTYCYVIFAWLQIFDNAYVYLFQETEKHAINKILIKQ